MEGLVRSNQDIKILTEFWPGSIARTGADATETLQYLAGPGLRTYVVDGRKELRKGAIYLSGTRRVPER